MISHLKNYIKRNKQDLFIFTAIILTGIIGFGVGRLSAPEKQPIFIQNMERVSVEELVPVKTAQEPVNTQNSGQQVVASKNSTKFHLPECPGAKQISEANKIWFNTIEDAIKAGYEPAGNCPGLQNK